MVYKLGIDIGGTNLRAALIDEYGIVEKKIMIENNKEQDATRNLTRLNKLIEKNFPVDCVETIGIASPGPLDIKYGVLLDPPNLPLWHKFPLKKYMEDHYHLPVVVNNDANAAALGEAVVGAGKTYESVYYITVSTGVGGGYVVNKKIIAGAHNLSGEIGNMIICDDAYQHANMNSGCVESQCSGTGIARLAKQYQHMDLNAESVFLKKEQGDNESKRIIEQWMEQMARMIANIILVVDPDIIVLGGSVMSHNPKYLELIKQKVSDRIYHMKPNLALAMLGDDAGLVGASFMFDEVSL